MAISEWTWAWPWWGSIVAINAINFIIGLIVFHKSKKSDNGSLSSYRKLMGGLGLVFIGVGFYRSIFISRYLTQLAWFDTLANSTLLIRSLALFADVVMLFWYVLQIMMRFSSND